MAVAELNPSSSCKRPALYNSLKASSFVLSRHYHHRSVFLRRAPASRGSKVCCSVTSNKIQAPGAVKIDDPKKKSDCYGVICLTYDLKAEEETQSWKKLINIAVSGAAGMISNHLLFTLASGKVFGPNQPIALKLLGSQRSIQALEDLILLSFN